jgi:predicted TIM-barrel fold metal-dependent hydrolase
VEITDAQMHLWGTECTPPPQLHGATFNAHQAIEQMDDAGIAHAVIVPPLWSHDVVGNSLGHAAVRDYPGRFCVMGQLDHIHPAPDELARWRETPGQLGIRIHTHNRSIAEGHAGWIWPVAEHAGIPVMMFAPREDDAVSALAARYPQLRIILDHLNLPGELDAGEYSARLERVLGLASHPNIAVKFSSVIGRLPDAYRLEILRPLVERVVGAFGAERCMFSSDMSVLMTGTPCTYRQWTEVFIDATSSLSSTERALVMGGAVHNWLDWRDEP